MSENPIDNRLADRLKSLRLEQDWSLDHLAGQSGISRASLSRIENGEVSPTANILGRLCSAYGLTLSRLMQMVEDDYTPLIRRTEQEVWHDPNAGFFRRSISPPAQQLAGEAIEAELQANQSIAYDRPPRDGLEHHLFLLEGALEITINGQSHCLQAGDCLRYRLSGPSLFRTQPDSVARYVLFTV
ncbi:MAG: helix-turn-helix domain-containing protein [Pseudomonadota bacterium]|uniref:helix-turn-helix domain-containing protein n=1 Tax=Fodinicurvata fenggangensis TaxID=1121830 RepID=UPI00047DCF16|nr:XRE family transcriptional regulator [Fodinicurvata fenggangensis]